MAGVVNTPCHAGGDLGRTMTTVVATTGSYSVSGLRTRARRGIFNAVVTTLGWWML